MNKSELAAFSYFIGLVAGIFFTYGCMNIDLGEPGIGLLCLSAGLAFSLLWFLYMDT